MLKIFADTTNFLPVIQRLTGDFVQVMAVLTEIARAYSRTSGQKPADLVEYWK
jgi:hypothetical protein